MPQSTQRAPLHLTEQQKAQLKQLSGSRTAPVREVQRAQVLLEYAEGRPIATISHQLRISRPSLYKCIDRALAAGVEVALKDKYHRPKAPVISAEAKAWVLHLACSKPTRAWLRRRSLVLVGLSPTCPSTRASDRASLPGPSR